MVNIDLNTPIWQLTVGEFLEIQKRGEDQKTVKDFTQSDKKYVYGLPGLAKLLGCSLATAGRIKQSGIINDAITQPGRIIVIDSEKALELISKHNQSKR